MYGYKVILLSENNEKIWLHFGSDYFCTILPDTVNLCRKFRYKKDAQECMNTVVRLGVEAKIVRL